MKNTHRNAGRGANVGKNYVPYGGISVEEMEEMKQLGRLQRLREEEEKERKKAAKEDEKQAENTAKQQLLEDEYAALTRGNDDEDRSEGIISKALGGLGGLAKKGVDAVKNAELNENEGNALERFGKGFTRGTANILDGIDPATWLLGDEQGFASKLGSKYGNDFIQDALKPAESGGQRALDMVGQIGGSLAPFGAAYKGTQKATDIAMKALSPDASDLALQAARGKETIAETAGTGAVAGGIYNQAGNVSAAVQGDDRTTGEKLTHSALEIGLGGAADVAIRGIGAGIKALSKAEPTNIVRNPADHNPELESRAFNSVDDMMDSVPRNEVADPFYTTARDESKKLSWNEKIGNKLLDVQKKWLDKNHGVRVLERGDIKERGGKGYGNERVYKALTVEQGAIPAAMDYVNQRVVPIFEKVRMTKGVANNAYDPNKDVLEYAMAMRGKDMMDRLGREAGVSLPKGMTPEVIDEILKRGEGSVMQEAHKELMEVMDELLVMVKESGYLSDAEYQAMKVDHPNYFPFGRDKEYNDDAFEQGFSRMFNKTGIQSLKEGSAEPIKDPVQQLINHVTGMHRIVARQQVKNELLNLNSQGSKLVKKLSRKEKGSGNIVDIKSNGENIRLDVHKELYEAVNRPLNEVERNLAVKIASVQRASIVMMPKFIVKEPFRSLPFAYVTSRSGMSVMDLGHAFVDQIANARGKRPKAYDDFIRNGGGMTSVLAQDIDARNAAYKAIEKGKGLTGFKAVNDPKQWLNMVRSFSEQLEQLPKYAEYLSTMRKGGDSLEATFNAREIYDHRISGSTVEKANKYVSFLNSNIRGKDKMYRAFRENPLRTTIRAGMVTAPPVLLANLAYDSFASDEQRRRIDEAPLELKELYTLIPVPFSDKEEIWRIPKPFEAHLLVGKPLEVLLESSRGTEYEWEIKEKVMAFAYQNLFHNPSLNPATPIYETVLNKDGFTGRNIVDPYDDRDKGEQIEPTTALTSVLLANMINSVPTFENVVSPKQVDHLVNGYFPSFGEGANRIIDRTFKDNLPNERALSINPFANAFEYNSNYSPTVNDFYEQRDSLAKEKREQGDDFLYEGVRKEVFGETEKELKHLRDLRKQVMNDASLSPQVKQRAVDELDQKRNELTRELYDAGLTGTKDKKNLTILEQALLN